MNRRDFIRGVAAGLSVTQLPNLLQAEETEASSPRAWLRNSPFIAVGSWDDMPIFQVRRGGAPVWYDSDYRQEHTEQTVKNLKDLGVTIAIIDFFKGFGLEAEKEHIDQARRLTALLHKFDIKVGLYVGSTIAYETFLLEKPEAEEWFVPDYLGNPVTYASQTFRKRVYFMHPGYVEYMKQVVRMGVEDLKAEMIHFDNTSMQSRPEIMQHPMAIKDFREYLTTKYTPEELTERLGFSNITYVEPPRVDFPLSAIDDPLFQLWTDFRCEQLNRYYAEMREYIRGLNPAVIIDSNPSAGMAGLNTIWTQGVSYPGLYPQLDVSWTEEGNYADVSPEGILISKIRTYKVGSILNTPILTYTARSTYEQGGYGGLGAGKLAMAESMAFNRQSLGMIGGTLDAPEIPDDQKRYVSFFHQQFDYYREVQNVADVAVLYSYASMGFNNDAPAASFMLFTQALIQAKVPFNIIFDDHLKDLSKYRVLVLADQECLSDDQMNLIRQYVNQGGGLVATGQTSLFTPWRLRRPDFGLKDLFQMAAPQWGGPRGVERPLEIPPVQNRVGQGRVSYIPAIKPAIPKPPSEPMSSQYWKLPLNWEELIEQIRWAAGGKFSLEVETPETLNVVAELIEQPGQNRRIVHLLNYAAPQGAAVHNIKVEVELPEGKQAGRVILLTPDGGESTTVQSQTSGGRVRFTVPHLDIYTLAIIPTE